MARVTVVMSDERKALLFSLAEKRGVTLSALILNWLYEMTEKEASK